MKNHSEVFNAIKTGTQLDQAAQFLQKSEQGLMDKIHNLWVKTGEAIAENGSLQTANALLAELKQVYPANRVGEKASAIAKAAQAKGMAIHFYQLVSGRGNPSAFHAEPKEPTKTEVLKAEKMVAKQLEKDIKAASKEGDSGMVAICTELKAEADSVIESLQAEADAEKANKAANRILAELRDGTLTLIDLEQISAAFIAEQLEAQLAAADPMHVQDAEDPTFWHYAHHAA